MTSQNEREIIEQLADQCQQLSQRLRRSERYVRLLGAIVFAAIVVPIVAGAYSTSDEIVLRDSASGLPRIVIRAVPNGPAFIQINSADGARRIHLGESDAGFPNLAIYNANGITVARGLAP